MFAHPSIHLPVLGSVALWLCLGCVCQARAGTWTLGATLHAAQTTHPLVVARQAETQAARALREGAQWLRYPTPSLEANQRSDGRSTLLLRLDQPLWSGGRIDAEITAAQRREAGSDAALEEMRLEVGLRVVAAVTEVARQQLRARTAAQGVAEHERLLAMIQRRVRQEVSPAADLRLAESRLFAMRNELAAVEQARRSALAQLAQLVGGRVDAVDVGSVEKAVDDLPESLEEALAEAVAHSPTLRRLSAEIEAADAEVRQRRAAYYPQVLARIESEHGRSGDNRVLLLLQAQPGSGLSALSNVEAALARREALRMQLDAGRREVSERASLDWVELRSARQRLDNAERVRSTAAEVAESYARQYVAGRKSWLDVLNAVREATLSEMALADIRAQYWAAALRLRLWSGRLATATGSPIPASVPEIERP